MCLSNVEEEENIASCNVTAVRFGSALTLRSLKETWDGEYEILTESVSNPKCGGMLEQAISRLDMPNVEKKL